MARVQVDPESLRIEKLVQLKPVSKTVKGGRKRRFSALVVAGDGAGHVGVGMGKSASVPDAIRKGAESARKNLVEVPLIDATVPHYVIGRTGAARMLVAAGVITRQAKDGVKILGQGELKTKLAFEVAGASKSAVAAIEKAGGSVKILAAASQA